MTLFLCAAAPKKNVKAKKKVNTTEEASASYQGESAAKRASSQYGALLLLAPLEVGAEAVNTMSADKQLFVIFNFFNNNAKADTDNDPNDTVQLDEAAATRIQLVGGMRFFMGNSFYLSAGGGVQSMAFTYSITETSTGDHVSGELKAHSVVVRGGIGNQWIWNNNFTLQVEWLAYTQPLLGSSSASTSVQGDTLATGIDELQKSTEDVGKRLAKMGTISALTLGVGMVF